MSQNEEKVRQEASLIGKILSMEALILAGGCLMLWYGFTEDTGGLGIFWGVIILVGFVILQLVRKKDWKKHFEEMEAEQKAREAYRNRMKNNTPEEKE